MNEQTTENDALRERLADGFAAGWGSVLDEEDAAFVAADPEARQTALYYADLILPTVQALLAEHSLPPGQETADDHA